MGTSAANLRRLACVWVLGLYALALTPQGFAQATDVPDTESIPQTGAGNFSLSGTVVNSLTGEPVRRALVQVSDANGGAAVTDDTGHFQLSGLKEGQAFVSVMKPGFGDADTPQTNVVQVGKDAPAVILKIAPAAVISGRVTTIDEQPLEGFQVHLIAKRNVAGHATWMDIPNQARTNDEGEYRISALSAGTYYVAVDHGTETRLSQRGVANAREEGFPKVFYPGVSEMSAATPVELGAGREAEANFVVSPEPFYRVSGEVVTQGEAVFGLTFTRRVGNDEDFTQLVGIQDGRFDAKLPAGSYEVSGASNNGVQLSTAGASVVISSDSANVHVPMAPAASVAVDLMAETGPAGAERSVRMDGGIPGIVISLASTESMRRQMSWWRGQPIGIQNVSPGTYTLQVQAFNQWWVKSAKCGGIDLLADDLTLVDGGSSAPIEITVRNDGASVSGTVTPAGIAEVYLVQQRGKKNFVKMAQEEQGNFLITGVPPGDYAVVAIEHGEQIEYANPDVMNSYLSLAEHISVGPLGKATVNLNLVPRGK
ncbi:MAG: carboxypeptidase-like regulatory domain-containing protein [Candidatus Sulfotelmatobacter sp.]